MSSNLSDSYNPIKPEANNFSPTSHFSAKNKIKNDLIVEQNQQLRLPESKIVPMITQIKINCNKNRLTSIKSLPRPVENSFDVKFSSKFSLSNFSLLMDLVKGNVVKW